CHRSLPSALRRSIRRLGQSSLLRLSGRALLSRRELLLPAVPPLGAPSCCAGPRSSRPPGASLCLRAVPGGSVSTLSSSLSALPARPAPRSLRPGDVRGHPGPPRRSRRTGDRGCATFRIPRRVLPKRALERPAGHHSARAGDLVSHALARG